MNAVATSRSGSTLRAPSRTRGARRAERQSRRERARTSHWSGCHRGVPTVSSAIRSAARPAGSRRRSAGSGTLHRWNSKPNQEGLKADIRLSIGEEAAWGAGPIETLAGNCNSARKGILQLGGTVSPGSGDASALGPCVVASAWASHCSRRSMASSARRFRTARCPRTTITAHAPAPAAKRHPATTRLPLPWAVAIAIPAKPRNGSTNTAESPAIHHFIP